MKNIGLHEPFFVGNEIKYLQVVLKKIGFRHQESTLNFLKKKLKR